MFLMSIIIYNDIMTIFLVTIIDVLLLGFIASNTILQPLTFTTCVYYR